MLTKVKMLEKFRVLNEGEEFHFRPGVNLLVGDQGSGKSSLLKILIDKDERRAIIYCDVATKTRSFDFEKDNPRTKNRIETMVDIATRWSSHGEVNRQMFQDQAEFKDMLIMMDEPDTALSIRSCHLLSESFKQSVANGCQIIAAVHNPIVISSFTEVFNMETRSWMKSEDFINSHKPSP